LVGGDGRDSKGQEPLSIPQNPKWASRRQAILGDLFDQLLLHREIVFAIADHLLRVHDVKGPRLKRLLRPIWGTE
jgi:hypothetical protein